MAGAGYENRYRSRKGKHWTRQTAGDSKPTPTEAPPVSAGDKSTTIERYGAKQSAKRLEAKGFHPSVTSLSPTEYAEKWLKFAFSIYRNPANPSVIDGEEDFYGATGYMTRPMTTASLIPRSETRCVDDHRPESSTGNALMKLLNVHNVACTLGEEVFASGRQAAQAFALSSKQMWKAILQNSNTWDFIAGRMHVNGKNGVFRVVQCQYTVGDILRARDLDPLNVEGTTVAGDWYKEAMEEENDIYLTIHLLHTYLTKFGGFGPLAGSMETYKLAAIAMLRTSKGIWSHRQFVTGHNDAIYEPQQMLLGRRLQLMVETIAQRRISTKVLHFEGTPFLDRRLLAVILRGCPYVTMLGVYDCPLIHFGDVICILDLIHEINIERRALNLPIIAEFDFAPRYLKGTSIAHSCAETYGLTWDPRNIEFVQRGFYTIIMKAFMKARALRLRLLFDENKAFRTFLFKVPMIPLGVPCFLDALHRYMESVGKEDISHQNERKKAAYDLLKAIRLHIEEDWARDTSHWYTKKMEAHSQKLFCCCCGFEAAEEFFTAYARKVPPPHARYCSGCSLQMLLETEPCHLLRQKRIALDLLFPGREPNEFNIEAPFPKGCDIMRLKTTESKRPPEASLYVNESGDFLQTRLKPKLVRDGKAQCDSLRNLPSLQQLVDGTDETAGLWARFISECHHLDVFCRTTRMLMDSKENMTEKQLKGLDRLVPTGKPDHVEEVQGQRVSDGNMQWSYTCSTAWEKQLQLVRNGLLPELHGMKESLKRDAARMVEQRRPSSSIYM